MSAGGGDTVAKMGNGSASFSRVRFIQLDEPIVPQGVAAGSPAQVPQPLRPRRDESRQRAAGCREREAYRTALILIRERNLPMKLTRVDFAPDGSRLVFYFTSEGRIDFRELVRELASTFHVRIEMRQIGVRDEARLLGGFGSCGRPLCCASWLHGFEPVSIKMAKQQELALNPWKLSGLCGRLKCCLRFELTGKECAGRSCDNGSGSEPPAGPTGE